MFVTILIDEYFLKALCDAIAYTTMKKNSLDQLNDLWARHVVTHRSKLEKSIDLENSVANLLAGGRSFFATLDFTIVDLDYVSDNITSVSGIPKDQFNLKNWLQRWHEEDYRLLPKMETLKEKFLFEFIPPEEILDYKICQTYRLRNSDGSYQHFLNQMTTLILTDNFKIQKTLLVQTDITHLRVPISNRLSFLNMKTGQSYYSDDLENIIKEGAEVTSLSERERKVLQLISLGLSSQDIADTLFISKNTVDTHRRNILRKTNCDNMLEVVSIAIRNGWV